MKNEICWLYGKICTKFEDVITNQVRWETRRAANCFRARCYAHSICCRSVYPPGRLPVTIRC